MTKEERVVKVLKKLAHEAYKESLQPNHKDSILIACAYDQAVWLLTDEEFLRKIENIWFGGKDEQTT